MSLHHIGPLVCHLTLHGEMHGDFLIGDPICPFILYCISYSSCLLKAWRSFLKKNPLKPLKDDYT